MLSFYIDSVLAPVLNTCEHGLLSGSLATNTLEFDVGFYFMYFGETLI
jgi:hypothetical protein